MFTMRHVAPNVTVRSIIRSVTWSLNLQCTGSCLPLIYEFHVYSPIIPFIWNAENVKWILILKKEKIILLLHLSFRYVLIMFLSTVNRREENQSIPLRSTFDNWLISKRRERKNDSIKKDRFNREEIQCVVQVNIRSDFIKNNFTIIQIILKSPCLIFMSRFPFRYPTTLVWNCKTADALLWANLF